MSVLCSGTWTRPALSAEKDTRKDEEYTSGFIFQKGTKWLAQNNQTTDNKRP